MSAPALEFDAPLGACPLCASRDIRDFDHDYRGVHIFKCRTCGVRFMNPQYTDAYLAAYYSDYIAATPGSPERRAFRLAQKTANIELLERYIAPGRLLSVGCGDGVELSVAKSRGWAVEGYDVDAATTQRVAQAVGVTVHTGDLFALPLERDSYDCVYLDQVLEHPKNPAQYLELGRRLLRSGGLLYLGVPNIESMAARAKSVLGRLGLSRRRGRFYDSFHHLFYYSPATLPALLERRYGFRVVTVLGDPKPRANPTVATRAWDRVVRHAPWLDSTFVILARPSS